MATLSIMSLDSLGLITHSCLIIRRDSGRVYLNSSCPEGFFCVTSCPGLWPGYPETQHLGNRINNRSREVSYFSQPFSHMGPERILRLLSAQAIRVCLLCHSKGMKTQTPRKTLTHRPGLSPVHYYRTILLCHPCTPLHKIRQTRLAG